MSEGEKVKRGTRMKVALIVVSALLVISLFVNLYFYTRQYGITPDGGLENQIADLQAQVSDLEETIFGFENEVANLESEKSGLLNEVANLESEKSGLLNEVTNLEKARYLLLSEIENLKSEKLIMVNLDGTDNRPLLGTPYLHVTGEVVNVGTYTAYNCKLHVVLYQGEVVAEDTYINLGTINGEGWKTVDSQIYYEGEELTAYSVTPEWG